MPGNHFHLNRLVRTSAAATLILFILAGGALQAQAPIFTQIIVFGDSLSDDGNIAHLVRDKVGFSYPSSNPEFNYSDYRFTNDFNTDPPSDCITASGTSN